MSDEQIIQRTLYTGCQLTIRKGSFWTGRNRYLSGAVFRFTEWRDGQKSPSFDYDCKHPITTKCISGLGVENGSLWIFSPQDIASIRSPEGELLWEYSPVPVHERWI